MLYVPCAATFVFAQYTTYYTGKYQSTIVIVLLLLLYYIPAWTPSCVLQDLRNNMPVVAVSHYKLNLCV